MARRYEGSARRWPWRRRRHRRRRAVGCLLWLLTLLLMLFVLAWLFGGFRPGSRVGGGPARAVPSARAQGAPGALLTTHPGWAGGMRGSIS